MQWDMKTPELKAFFISQTHNLLNKKVRQIKTCVCASTAEWGSLLFSSLKNLVNH